MEKKKTLLSIEERVNIEDTISMNKKSKCQV